jgi:hypothetical protein
MILNFELVMQYFLVSFTVRQAKANLYDFNEKAPQPVGLGLKVPDDFPSTNNNRTQAEPAADRQGCIS